MENQGHDQEHRGSRNFKGIRLRKWGSWVSEIRIPKCRDKLWLGSYKTPEQAARAYDAAVYCLRGPNAKFNFPDSVPDIPSVSSLSRQDIQDAAFRYALSQPPSSLPSLTTQASLAPLPSSSVSEMMLCGDKQEIPEEWPWWSLFEESDGSGIANLENFPSIDEVSALEITPSSQEEGYIATDLWNFRDV